jgi:hypothetical protein
MANIFTGIISAVIGAVFGSGGTYLAQRRMYKRQAKRDKRKIRKAIKQEISEFLEIEILSVSDVDPEIPGSMPNVELLSTTIYESLSHKLGVLEEEELEAIIKYYGYISQYKARREIYRV